MASPLLHKIHNHKSAVVGGVRPMFNTIKNLDTNEVIEIAKKSMRGSLIFFILVFSVVFVLKVALDWSEGKPVGNYFTLEIAEAFFKQPLFYYAIFQMFVIYFISGVYSAAKKKHGAA